MNDNSQYFPVFLHFLQLASILVAHINLGLPLVRLALALKLIFLRRIGHNIPKYGCILLVLIVVTTTPISSGEKK
jgi:hypothetical protein